MSMEKDFNNLIKGAETMTIKQIAKKYSKPEKEFGYRMDGRIEWHCKHGIGHTVWSPRKDDVYYIHGCDGCCKKLEERKND